MPVWAEKPRKNGSRCQTPDLRGRTFGDKGQVWGQVSYLGTIIPGEEGQTAGEAKVGRGEAGKKSVCLIQQGHLSVLAPDRASQSDSHPVDVLERGGLTSWIPG